MKKKKIQVGLFQIVAFKEDYLENIEKVISEWREHYENTPVKVNADVYYASCIDFKKTEKLLDVRFSKETTSTLHKRKAGEKPKPITIDDDEDLENVTFLRFYFGKNLCFFISTKDVSAHAPARFINWSENLIKSTDNSFLEGFTVKPYMKKDKKEELEALTGISWIELKFDSNNASDYTNQIAQTAGLPSMKAFDGKFKTNPDNSHSEDLKKNILEIYSKNPDKLIVNGKFRGKSKRVNLTEARYTESAEITGILTQEEAFKILSKKFSEFIEKGVTDERMV
jgi:hypothetical protein